MDLLKDRVKPLYFRYLAAAFGSALTSSIYSVVDMAMVGQYQGPDGTAALAVVAPVWNIIYSFGLLAGIGGSVLFSTLRGSGKTRHEDENEYFTTALGLSVVFAALWWIVIAFFDVPMLRLFGASDALLPLAQDYVLPIKFVVPFFLFNQMLAAFLRNDGNPGLATAGVLAGGIFNIFGDYFFVFTCDMGIFGVGLATAIGATITFFVMLMHFLLAQMHAAAGAPGSACCSRPEQIIVTGFCHLLYRRGDGYPDHAVQPSDHALYRRGRPFRSTASSSMSARSYSAAPTASGRPHSRSSRATSAQRNGHASGRRCATRCTRLQGSACSGPY